MKQVELSSNNTPLTQRIREILETGQLLFANSRISMDINTEGV